MPDIWELAAIATKFMLYLGVLTSAGTVFVALLFGVANIRWYSAGFAMIGLLGAVLGFALGGAALTGDASGMTDPEMLGLLWSTPVGTALALRLAGLGVLILGLMLGGFGLWLSAVGGMLSLWSFSIIGHVPDPDASWLRVLLLVHLVGIAFWIGILTPLRRLAIGATAQETARLGHRFGRLAVFFVPLLLGAGIVMSYALVGTFTDLLATAYGQFLILKVTLVSGLLCLGAVNKTRFVPGLLAGETKADQHLSRSIAVEWVVVVLILLVTAILTSVLNLPS